MQQVFNPKKEAPDQKEAPIRPKNPFKQSQHSSRLMDVDVSRALPMPLIFNPPGGGKQQIIHDDRFQTGILREVVGSNCLLPTEAL